MILNRTQNSWNIKTVVLHLLKLRLMSICHMWIMSSLLWFAKYSFSFVHLFFFALFTVHCPMMILQYLLLLSIVYLFCPFWCLSVIYVYTILHACEPQLIWRTAKLTINYLFLLVRFICLYFLYCTTVVYGYTYWLLVPNHCYITYVYLIGLPVQFYETRNNYKRVWWLFFEKFL